MFWVGVLVVDVVTHADELLCTVGAGEKDDGHAHHVLNGDLTRVRGVSLEHGGLV